MAIPARQHLLPRPDARRRQQLEERSAPEQVEVGSIGMIGGEKPQARLAGPSPRVRQARDAELVKR